MKIFSAHSHFRNATICYDSATYKKASWKTSCRFPGGFCIILQNAVLLNNSIKTVSFSCYTP